MDQDKLAIVARNVGVQYNLRFSRRTTVKQTLQGLVSGKRARRTVKFWALRDVSFALKRGDILGIIGSNGAGKSTLMMCIAGVLPPDRGAVWTFGKTSMLFSLGTGFDMEASGRENIYLNAAFLGLRRKEIDDKLDEIIEFSELGSFMEAPVRTYSSGMIARLSFAIACNIEPEILLLDEVMGSGVGDAAFKEKSETKVDELRERAKAMVVVTHSTQYVTEHCTKAMWLDEGLVVATGDPHQVVEAYLARSREKSGAVRKVGHADKGAGPPPAEPAATLPARL